MKKTDLSFTTYQHFKAETYFGLEKIVYSDRYAQ